MKKSFRMLAALIGFFCFSFSLNAQDVQKSPGWVSDKGYWVVESNQNDHTIRFYNNNEVLLYQEKLTGVKLDPTKRKVKMKLKKVLETTVVAWENKKTLEENKAYVAAILK